MSPKLQTMANLIEQEPGVTSRRNRKYTTSATENTKLNMSTPIRDRPSRVCKAKAIETLKNYSHEQTKVNRRLGQLTKMRASPSDYTTYPDGEPRWEVKKITNHRLTSDGVMRFEVVWITREVTEEPAECLDGSLTLVNKYLKTLGQKKFREMKREIWYQEFLIAVKNFKDSCRR